MARSKDKHTLNTHKFSLNSLSNLEIISIYLISNPFLQLLKFHRLIIRVRLSVSRRLVFCWACWGGGVISPSTWCDLGYHYSSLITIHFFSHLLLQSKKILRVQSFRNIDPRSSIPSSMLIISRISTSSFSYYKKSL